MADADQTPRSQATMAVLPGDSTPEHLPSHILQNSDEDRLLFSERVSTVIHDPFPPSLMMPTASSGQDNGPTTMRSASDLAESHLRGRRSKPLRGSISTTAIASSTADPRSISLQSPTSERANSGAGDGKRGFASHASQPHTLPYQQQGQSGGSIVSPTSSLAKTRSLIDQPTGANVKIPFSHPVISPPRQHPHQILMINPTSTTSLTNILVSTLRPILPAALEVTAFTGSWPCPTAVESTTDALLSSEYCLRELAKYSTNNSETIQNFDGLLVCNFGKHPLVEALRESYDVPVVGIMEASLYVARMLGARFGILVLNKKAAIGIEDAVSASGMGLFSIGIEVLRIPYLDLVHKSPDLIKSPAPSIISATSPIQPPSSSEETKAAGEMIECLSKASRSLITRGADTIILGSECLSSNTWLRAIKDAIRDEDGKRTANVIDPVEAGIMMLNGLVGMGVPTSKKGLYKNERDARLGRGQMWM